MKNDTRGLSAVVTTLIIILLSIVAVGIVWVVVNEVIKGGAEDIDYATKCFSVELELVSVTATEGESGNYSVSLSRKSGGDVIGGVKVNLFNATDNSGVIDFGTVIDVVATETEKIEAGLTDVDKIEFTAYFVDTSGDEHLCTTATATF